MKFKSILMLTAILGIASTSMAQFVSAPRKGIAFTSAGTANFTVTASSTTNIPSAYLQTYYLDGVDNVSFYAAHTSGGASTEGILFTFQVTADGVNWFTPDAAIPSSVVDVKAGTTPQFLMTNFVTSAQLRNLRAIRLTSITNGTQALTISNAFFLSR